MKTRKLWHKLKADYRNYWRNLKRQRAIHGLDRDFSDIYEEVHREARPVFVLSTGRCGTMLLTRILEQSDEVWVHHEPRPELSYHSKLAYERPRGDEQLKMAIDMARYEYIRDAYLLGKRYVETNNRITFFAYYLAELYPKAQFVHLVRDKEAFVNSGMKRGWYQSSLYDEGRIRDEAQFRSMDQKQKISWLWEETNGFIEGFENSLGSKIFKLTSENLFIGDNLTKSLFSKINVTDLDVKGVKKIIKNEYN